MMGQPLAGMEGDGAVTVDPAAILAVEGLTIGDAARRDVAPIVDDLTLSVLPGTAFGIAGESGCGKSTLLLAMMGMIKTGLRRWSGDCRFAGVDLFAGDARELERLRGGRVALIPQNAGIALTPNIRIGDQIAEALEFHAALPPTGYRARIEDLLEQVKLPTPAILARRYPHELSGGQLQRVGIAMALAGEPELLLLDEPTTGLDVTTQLGILNLLSELRRKKRMAMICVSHDLGVIASLCERVAIMYAGRMVESGPAVDMLRRPSHPYSRALLSSIPRLSTARIPSSIPGRPPAPEWRLPGCRFAPRCAHALEDCDAGAPALRSLDGDRAIACRHPQGAGVDAAPMADAPRDQGLEESRPQIEIAGLVVTYHRHQLLDTLLARQAPKRAVDDLSFALRKGEILGLVGESGSGKSTILRAIAGLWPVLQGRITFGAGIDITVPVRERAKRTLQAIQLIFQNPDASLNPRHSVEEILAQPLRLYFDLTPDQIAGRARALLAEVKLDATYLGRYPGALSGGERQRVAIARAFAAEPDVILCDEITSALDVSVQASILQLIHDLAVKRQVACLFVSHDLAVVRALAHRVAVMHQGRLVELDSAQKVCSAPSHPYTQSLLAAVLEPEVTVARAAAS